MQVLMVCWVIPRWNAIFHANVDSVDREYILAQLGEDFRRLHSKQLFYKVDFLRKK